MHIKNLMTKLVGASVMAAIAVTAIAGEAAALNAGVISCKNGTVTGTTECEGVFEKNNSNQDLNGLFDLDWGTEALKVKGSGGTDGPLTITSKNNKKKGTWKLEQSFVDEYDEIMFVVKGGPSFSAYLWDGLATSGTWDTLGLQKGNGKAKPSLSHISVYAMRTPEPKPASIPEPAAMFGLVAVGAGILVKRRQDIE